MRVYFGEFVHGFNDGKLLHFENGVSIMHNPTLYRNNQIHGQYADEHLEGALPESIFLEGQNKILVKIPEVLVYSGDNGCALSPPRPGGALIFLLRDINIPETAQEALDQIITYCRAQQGPKELDEKDIAWAGEIAELFPEAEFLRSIDNYI